MRCYHFKKYHTFAQGSKRLKKLSTRCHICKKQSTLSYEILRLPTKHKQCNLVFVQKAVKKQSTCTCIRFQEGSMKREGLHTICLHYKTTYLQCTSIYKKSSTNIRVSRNNLLIQGRKKRKGMQTRDVVIFKKQSTYIRLQETE